LHFTNQVGQILTANIRMAKLQFHMGIIRKYF